MLFKSIVLFSSLCFVAIVAKYIDDGDLDIPALHADDGEFVEDMPTVLGNELEYSWSWRNKNHSTFFGERVVNDSLIFTGSAKISFSNIGLGCTTLDINFTKGTNIKNATINYIEAVDRIANYRSGRVSNPAGGVGYDYATLRFRTQGFRRPLDFLINIFGK